MGENVVFNSDKLLVEIYVPLDSCSCVWDHFMNSIFNILQPYVKLISFKTKNINSEEARSRNIYGNCVLVDSKLKFTSSLSLKNKLPQLLEEKGLL